MVLEISLLYQFQILDLFYLVIKFDLLNSWHIQLDFERKII